MSESFARRHARTRRFTLGVPRDLSVADSGRRVSFLRSRSGTDPVTCLWTLDLDDGRGERLVADPAELEGLDEDELPPAERARRERAREAAGGIVGYDVDEDHRRYTFALGGRLFVAEPDGPGVVGLDAVTGVYDPRLRPGRADVAYVAGTDLRLTGPGGDRLLAGGEDDDVSWGAAEFVAAEEMGRGRGHWWAPDGAHLLATRVDTAPVERWWISNPADPRREPQTVRYPAAGTPNARVALMVLEPEAPEDVRAIEWDDDGNLEYLAAVQWLDPTTALLVAQDRRQRRVVVWRADVLAGRCDPWREITDAVWVELVPGSPAVMDGRLVTVEDVDDTRSVLVDGEVVTPPGLQVRRVVTADAGGVWFEAATEASEVQVHQLDPSGRVVALTSEPGLHRAAVSGGTVAVSSSRLASPVTDVVIRAADGTEARLDDLSSDPGVGLDVTLTTAGDRRLPVALVLPTWYEGATPLPVLVDPYGGPHAQRVVAAHKPHLVSQWFADQGFAVVVADGRGTPGRGPAWERAVAGDLAGPVLDDQVDALLGLAADHPELDLTRVGIRGWSFGGYLAALAVLRRPDVFHAAVAGAPVTDWRLYDTHYTERYLGHPDEDPEAYVRSSLLPDAPGLDRPLLLVHGLADDNVVAAHTLVLSRALLEAGRPHEVLPLSGVTHMTPQEVVAESLLVLQLDFLRRHLGVGPAPG